ncbi:MULTISPECIES: alpha/beta hydrolase [Streptomyces]|uniref:alpha/beta hydrolase n=1 Tax=Streptomyces TaxID=1883 RepID=UPI0018FE97CD|nr:MULTISPECIES: alpha/beta hydrolase [Streptomyces]
MCGDVPIRSLEARRPSLCVCADCGLGPGPRSAPTGCPATYHRTHRVRYFHGTRSAVLREGHLTRPLRLPHPRHRLSGLPPAYISVAEIDPLRDEDRNYVALLSAAGVTTELVQVPGAAHGFDLLFPSARISERSLANQVRAPNEALHS